MTGEKIENPFKMSSSYHYASRRHFCVCLGVLLTLVGRKCAKVKISDHLILVSQ